MVISKKIGFKYKKKRFFLLVLGLFKLEKVKIFMFGLLSKIWWRKRLFAGTIPANKNEFDGTVPANKNAFAGIVPANKNIFAGTISED